MKTFKCEIQHIDDAWIVKCSQKFQDLFSDSSNFLKVCGPSGGKGDKKANIIVRYACLISYAT